MFTSAMPLKMYTLDEIGTHHLCVVKTSTLVSVRVLVLGQTEDRDFLKIQFCIYFFSLVEQNLLR